MFLEMAHGFAHRFEPLTVCTYDIDAEDILDLRAESGHAAAGITLADLAAPWAWDLAEGRDPASWRIACGAGPGVANLVLWRGGPDPPHRVTVHDPNARLPRDATSWRE